MNMTSTKKLFYVSLLTALLAIPSYLHAKQKPGHYGAKDLNIVVRPIAEVAPPVPATNQLKVSAWVDRRDNTYRIGQKLRLFVRTNKDAYITVINVGSSGKVHQLFPNRYQTEHFIPAHTNVQIPGHDDRFLINVSGPAGHDLIKVVATECEDPLIDKQYLSQSVLPEIKQTTHALAKDLTLRLREPAYEANTVTYNKVIRIHQ